MSATLLATIATGSRADSDAAFSELVSVWQQPLTGFAYKMLRDWGSAEDVFQSVMLTVFQHAGNFRETATVADEVGSTDPTNSVTCNPPMVNVAETPASCFQGWIYSICHRRAIDVIRKRRNDALSQRVSPTDDFDPLSAIPGGLRSPIDALVEREELDEIAVAMDTIPDDQRAVLELFNEGFSFGEIADASGANPHTTKRRAQLARQKTLGRVIDARMASLAEKMFS